MIRARTAALALIPLVVIAAASCSGNDAPTADASRTRVTASPQPAPAETSTPLEEETTNAESKRAEPVNRWVTVRPAWLGKRVLPERPDGLGVVQPTPPILRNRRLPTIDLFAPPESKRFTARIGPVPDDVVERSSWRPKCPVSLEQLSYIKMTFWGFDHKPHTGEMIVHAVVAEQVADVFRQLYEAHFPIEEMRVITLREQRAKPTGDTNVTSSFECRKVTLGETWSQHAYGLAIDINPFHNPYARGDLVAPELASAYIDRAWQRPGMIFEGDLVTRAFDAIGWGWGGRWNSLRDWMHFSQNGN